MSLGSSQQQRMSHTSLTAGSFLAALTQTLPVAPSCSCFSLNLPKAHEFTQRAAFS